MPTTVGKVNGFHILWFVVFICEYKHIGERDTNTSYINITHLVVEFPALYYMATVTPPLFMYQKCIFDNS